MLKIMMALVLGVQYWDYHICVMGTQVIAQHSRMVDSFPVVSCSGCWPRVSLSFSLFLAHVWFSFVLSCLFLSIYPVTPDHFSNLQIHNLFVPPNRRFLSCLCCISLEGKDLALELSQSLMCYFF